MARAAASLAINEPARVDPMRASQQSPRPNHRCGLNTTLLALAQVGRIVTLHQGLDLIQPLNVRNQPIPPESLHPVEAPLTKSISYFLVIEKL